MKSEAINFYIDHPVEFAIDILKVQPTLEQQAVMNDVAKFPMVSVKSGHGVGKSALESWIIWWYISTRPYPKILCTAPTKHQLHDILWAEVSKWKRNSKSLDKDFEWTSEKIYLKGSQEEWFAIARTSNKPDALQGTHAEHVLIIIDEASGVPDIVFEPVLGSMSTIDAKLLMCGNPTQLAGFFYESHTTKRELYKTHTIDGSKCERVDKNYVQTIIDMFGKDSDVYRVRVAGEFPKANPDSFIGLDMIRTEKKVIDIVESIDLGVDVARYGDDESVVATTYNKSQVERLNVFKHNDTMRLTGQIVNIIKMLNLKYPSIIVRVKIDCDGLGVGVYDRLKEVIVEKNLKAKAIECHFGGKGGKVSYDEPIEYYNSTGIMWGTLRSKLKNNEITIPNNEELIKQITNRKYFINSDGTIKLERKEDMKKRNVHSPDRADAVVLSLYEPQVKMKLSDKSFI
jgi:hypothetical protein